MDYKQELQRRIVFLTWVAMFSLPLAAWKVIEIIAWIIEHVSVDITL